MLFHSSKYWAQQHTAAFPPLCVDIGVRQACLFSATEIASAQLPHGLIRFDTQGCQVFIKIFLIPFV
jgi:hypothetical protein